MDRTCRTRPRPSRDLPALARQLDAIADELGWDAPPLLLGLTDDGTDEREAPLPATGGTRPDDLVGALVGFVAPDDWRALAVVVHGRGFDLADRSADPRPVRLVHVVERQGRSASVLRTEGDASFTEGGEGRLVDVCRRALGLATAPAPDDSTEVWAVLWLDRLLAAAARGEPATTAREAALAHPAIELFAAHEPSMTDAAIGRLVRLGRLMGQARPWPDLRTEAAAGRWPVEDLTPEGAAWMDDGMFARWVLGGFPAPAELLAELDGLLPERVARAVRETVEAWDLPTAQASR